MSKQESKVKIAMNGDNQYIDWRNHSDFPELFEQRMLGYVVDVSYRPTFDLRHQPTQIYRLDQSTGHKFLVDTLPADPRLAALVKTAIQVSLVSLAKVARHSLGRR